MYLRKDIREEVARFAAEFEYEAVVIILPYRIKVGNIGVVVAEIATTADLATLAINPAVGNEDFRSVVVAQGLEEVR
jgi:hypothetical protein